MEYRCLNHEDMAMEISRNCGRASDFHRQCKSAGAEPVRPYEKMTAALASSSLACYISKSLWKFAIGRPIEESVLCLTSA